MSEKISKSYIPSSSLSSSLSSSSSSPSTSSSSSITKKITNNNKTIFCEINGDFLIYSYLHRHPRLLLQHRWHLHHHFPLRHYHQHLHHLKTSDWVTVWILWYDSPQCYRCHCWINPSEWVLQMISAKVRKK